MLCTRVRAFMCTSTLLGSACRMEEGLSVRRSGTVIYFQSVHLKCVYMCAGADRINHFHFSESSLHSPRGVCWPQVHSPHIHLCHSAKEQCDHKDIQGQAFVFLHISDSREAPIVPVFKCYEVMSSTWQTEIYYLNNITVLFSTAGDIWMCDCRDRKSVV